MPRIHTIVTDTTVQDVDILIGSDGDSTKGNVTRNYTVGSLKTHILTTGVNGSYSGNLTVGGNLSVTGNTTIDGNLTFGNADTDTVAFGADIVSNIIPDVTDTYTLGNTAKRWKEIYISGSSSFADNTKAIFGTDNDLEIFHDASEPVSYIIEKNNPLHIQGSSVSVRNVAGEAGITFTSGAAVTLLYNNSTKFATTNDGINVDGSVIVKAGQDEAAQIEFKADAGDNNSDHWKLSAETDNVFEIQTRDSGSYAAVVELSSSDKKSIFHGPIKASEITSDNDLMIKADADANGGNCLTTYKTRFDQQGGTDVSFNVNQPGWCGGTFNRDVYASLQVGDVIHGLNPVGPAGQTNGAASRAITQIIGFQDNGSQSVDAASAVKFRVRTGGPVYYADNQGLTVLGSGVSFSNSNNRNIKLSSGGLDVVTVKATNSYVSGNLSPAGSVDVTGNIVATGTVVANNTDTINGININNTNQEMSGIGDIYAHKFIDSQTGTHYLDPGNSALSLVVAGKATIGAFTIPKTIGTSGQILKVPSSGTELEWGASTGVPHIINYTNNTNSVSVGYSAWAAGGPQTGDGGAIENVAFGIGAMNSILQGDGNVSVGYNANTGLSFGDFNIAIGHKAGASSGGYATNLTTGDRNILIGANAGVDNAGTFNAIIIGTHHDIDNGNGIVASSHQTIIGNDETNNAVVKGLRQEVRTSPATDTLSDVRGTDANKITLLDSTSAITITLPDSGSGTEVGKTYTFATKTTPTGGDIHKIVCSDTANEKIIGGMSFLKANSTPGAFIASGTNNFSAINLNGTTQGGIEGTIFSLTCIASDIWLIKNATIVYSGTSATPFTTS